jgi:hypothetical protein
MVLSWGYGLRVGGQGKWVKDGWGYGLRVGGQGKWVKDGWWGVDTQWLVFLSAGLDLGFTSNFKI